MADGDEKLDSHKHQRKKGGTPEWSETCIGFWSKTHKEIPSKENDDQRRCWGISILHLNKFANASKVKNIPTTGIEIVIREKDVTQDVNKRFKDIESTQEGKPEGDELKDPSDEATPKILEKVAENWGKRCHNIGARLVKYYNDPRSSTEILTDIKKSVTTGYQTTFRILSYCHPQEKAKQISNFISERLKNASKWWKE
ncbi:uncharacterized protein LOC114518242 [Dendronephthya gigantea]|uniref:uncharacterized protein LOC114518242 n=1 Tax=Dendronephthya gigantea TaxID=151771 RepID=UPI001069E8D9|nr:uncharacterized protein LOC114518242 [Dendronephthya gigantea]